ncbi:MAG: hypothetical protein ACQR33_02090 [Candidatus Saccharibacteria bacterium]
MKYVFLIVAGLFASVAHFYVVWRHSDDRRCSVSEHAMLSKQSHLIYFFSHVICEILFLLFSYQFFIREHNYWLPFYLNVAFAVLDFAQAVLPSRGKTEKIHFASAYISWCCYLLAGLLALFAFHVSQPYLTLSILVIIPVLAMFMYMHINRTKLYPYQLAMVPLFVVYMLFVAIGSS